MIEAVAADLLKKKELTSMEVKNIVRKIQAQLRGLPEDWEEQNQKRAMEIYQASKVAESESIQID